MNSFEGASEPVASLLIAATILLTGILFSDRCAARSSDDSKTLIVVGSESLAPVIERWSADLKHAVPEAVVRMQATGSDTAAPALADGVAHMAAMSRVMEGAEIRAFEARRGFRPIPVRVAIDAVTVLVNATNPTRGLSLAQVDAIFSVSRRCGAAQEISSWGAVAPAGVWLSRPMQLFVTGALSGTQDYFRERALCGGEFKPGVTVKASSKDLVRAVGDSVNAIGFAAMAFRAPGVKALPLASAASAHFVAPTADNALSGAYPLTRYLYLYVAKPRGGTLPILVRQFLGLALSDQGQRRVAEIGYVPLPANSAAQDLARLR